MKKRVLFFWLFPILALISSPASAQFEGGPIAWQKWSDQAFQTAKKENKFVILDLEAVWCHWCHVMADTTYKDPQVANLINSKYIPVRVDQDANPDISLRYEDWGWPATVVFAPDGTEIVKRRGYIPPQAMASLLDAIIKDPTPGPSVQPDLEIAPSDKAFLSDAQKQKLKEDHEKIYDQKFGGWGDVHKLIDADHWEYAVSRAEAGDKEEEARARRTLDQALNLLDAEWGGFYQYSDEADWKSPHFEKIMPIQAQYLKIYSYAYRFWHDERYLDAAKKTADYVKNFWVSPEGAFYASQDADVDEKTNGYIFYAMKDADRKKFGSMPNIDTHLYARENGWMIASLAALYDASADEAYLKAAERAAQWVVENRALPQGGFRHDAEDRNGPYLGDTLAMGQAFLSLYVSSADRQWLAKSEAAADFIENSLKDASGGGYQTSPVPAGAQGVLRKPVKQVEENTAIARWTNTLFYYTGKEQYKKMAEHAMRYLASPAITSSRGFLTGLLLADAELASEPAHMTILGPKDADASKALYRAALSYPVRYRRVEWWDRREGPLPSPDVDYPELEAPAAFTCANKSCSTPFLTPEKLVSGLNRIQSKS